MKNMAFGLVLVLFSFPLAFSQNKPHTLLWEISKKGSDQKSYLFGTFHEVNPDFFDSIKVANEYLKKSKVLLVEAYDSPNPDSLKIQAQKAKASMSSWNKAKWDLLLNATQKEKFAAYVKSPYSDEELYNNSPQLLTFILLRNYYQGICDTANRSSYETMDSRIINLGLKNNLKVMGLEKNQINIINTNFKADAMFSDNSSLNMILELMDYITKGNTNTEVAKLLLNYKKFDINYRLGTISKSTDQILLVRNNNWMKAIPGHIDQNPCFIAVGFKHLMLKTGLIEQLRQLGYTVKPVKI